MFHDKIKSLPLLYSFCIYTIINDLKEGTLVILPACRIVSNTTCFFDMDDAD